MWQSDYGKLAYGELVIWQTAFGELAYGEPVHGKTSHSRLIIAEDYFAFFEIFSLGYLEQIISHYGPHKVYVLML